MKTDIRNQVKMFDKTPPLPETHVHDFEMLLERSLPADKSKPAVTIMRIAASIVFLFGLGYFMFSGPDTESKGTNTVTDSDNLRLTEISPELKKIENYYITVFNLEMTRLPLDKADKNTQRLYFDKLSKLTREYKLLDSQKSPELSDEERINMMIDNLQMRLKLLKELKTKIRQNNTYKYYENKQI